MGELSVDVYLDRKYNLTGYNCGHFVADVWKDLTSQDISEICSSFIEGDDELYSKLKRQFKKLRQPENPCLALMQSRNVAPHVGVYVNGRILHLSDNGVCYDSLCLLEIYWRLSYYK